MFATNIFSGKNTWRFSLFVFLIYLCYRIALIFHPHPDAGGVENNVIWFIQRLLNGDNLYTNPEASPYAIAQYSPLYYYLNYGVAKLLGIGPDNVLSLFSLSRSISLILNIFYVILIFKTAKNIFNAPARHALVAAVFAFIFLEITSFSRPDSLSHVFFLLSFYCFAYSLSHKKVNIYLVYSAIFAFLALFSKQSTIVLPLIIVSWFVWKKQFKPGLIYFFTYFILCVIAFIAIHFEWGLVPFFQNAIMGINNGISLHWFFSNIVKEFYGQFGLIWIPALILIMGLLKKEKSQVHQFMALCLGGVFIFSNLIALKFGSSPGYFTDCCGLLFISVAAYWDAVFKNAQHIYKKAGSATIIFILLVKLMLIAYPTWNMVRPGARENRLKSYRLQEGLAVYFKKQLQGNKEKKIFNNLYSPDTYLNNLLFRSSILPQYEIVMYGTWNNKVFDYAQLKKEVEDGAIQYIIQRKGAPLQFMDMPFPNYAIKDSSFAGYTIYEYKY